MSQPGSSQQQEPQRDLVTNKGNRCRLVNGYTMQFQSLSDNGLVEYWRCSKQKKSSGGCSARGKRTVGNADVVMNDGSAHNHPPDPLSPLKREKKAALKEQAAANYATPSRSIASEVLSGLSEEELVRLPSQRNLQRTVAATRRVEVGPGADKEPKDIELPDMLKQTEVGKPFLLVDSRSAHPDEPVFLAFCSETGAQLLKENQLWCADGTFFSSPKHFDNVFTMNAMVGNSSLPAIFLLMPDRRQVTYERALAEIFATPLLHGVKPDAFICDFELALSNSMRKQFPDAAVYYCLFHLAKAAWVQIQKKGLLALYSIPEVRALLRCFPALATLPPNEVRDGFADIVAALRALIPTKIPRRYYSKLNNYVAYFGTTYVGRSNARGVYTRPRYLVEEWNVHDRILNEEPRTNNANEGFNASFNALFPKADLPLSQFIIRVRKEEERTRGLVVRNAVMRAEPVRGRPSSSSVRQRNLLALVQEYAKQDPATRDRLGFLRKAQYLLSETAFAKLMKDQAAENASSAAADIPSTSQCSSQDAAASSSQPSDCWIPPVDSQVENVPPVSVNLQAFNFD